MSWIELSRPTVNGSTACGNKTVSLTGKTGILRILGMLLDASLLSVGGMEGWFCIECPLINFPSLDSAGLKKFHNLRRVCPVRPSAILLHLSLRRQAGLRSFSVGITTLIRAIANSAMFRYFGDRLQI